MLVESVHLVWRKIVYLRWKLYQDLHFKKRSYKPSRKTTTQASKCV